MELLLENQAGTADSEEFAELYRAITRYLTLFLSGLGLAFLYVLGAYRPAVYLSGVAAVALTLVVAAALTLRMVADHPLLAKVILQLGCLAASGLAAVLLGAPEFSLALLLLPMLAVMTGGWRLGLASQIGLSLLALGWYLHPLVPGLPANFIVIIPLGAALLGVLAAIALALPLRFVRQAAAELRQAREGMRESRQQRVELIQTQADLLHANRELARLSLHLKALTQVAEEARRVKEEFVANVSHELRTPLNMIIGFSELITKAPRVYGELSPTLLADISAIQRNSQHLAELVNDVLDLSQIEAGRMNLVKDWTSVQELVETAVSAVKVLYDTKGLYLRVDVPVEPLRVFCDRTRVREVLLNLLSNAGRFTEQGGVVVRASQDGEHLLISVSDTGPGITPENQARLFEPFQQLDNSTRRREGTGLGLSISKRFVEMHNGRMWLESQPGAGTSFSFTLPVAQPVPNYIDVAGARRWITPYHQYEHEAPRVSRAPQPVIVPRYVLLDQGSALQRLFTRFLGDVEIVNTSVPTHALAEVSRVPANCLVINGATASQVDLEGTSFATPVLTCWITGFDEMARRMGVDGYLLKPVGREKLLHALSQIRGEIRTVLLVDDDIEVLQLFARILTSAERGYSVLRARNGLQALEILRERKPDVMLIDLVMPEMDGFQVIKEKARDASIRDIPVIVVSSKDPTGAPILSDHLTVTRKGGISARELLLCIQAVSGILDPKGAPEPSPADPQPESDPGPRAEPPAAPVFG